MLKKILVFTDLDGTLLDHYTYQTDEATEMIATLKLNEIDIIPNSSKTLPEISLIREQLDLSSPFIIENGAAVFIPINYCNGCCISRRTAFSTCYRHDDGISLSSVLWLFPA